MTQSIMRTIPETCAQLHISRSTFRRLRLQGEIKVVKLKGKAKNMGVRVSQTEIDRFVDRNTRAGI